jgi:hypothetical protein
MKITITGDDAASALRDWIKEDIKKGPSFSHELGKFLFGVSTGTLTLFVALLKFAVTAPTLDLLTSGCFVLLLLSGTLALYMAKPYVVKLSTNVDLAAKYGGIIKSSVRRTWVWYGLWFVGFLLGCIKLFE